MRGCEQYDSKTLIVGGGFSANSQLRAKLLEVGAEHGDEPYYPINTEADKALYARYEELAKAEPKTVFGGRLGTYKYYDMHNVIDTALTAYEEQVEPLLKK